MGLCALIEDKLGLNVVKVAVEPWITGKWIHSKLLQFYDASYQT